MTNVESVPLGLQLETCFDPMTFVGLLWQSNLKYIKANIKRMKKLHLKHNFQLTNLFCLAFEIKASAFLETRTKRRKRKEPSTSTDARGAVTSSEHKRAAKSLFYLERHSDLPHRRVIVWKTLKIINNNKTNQNKTGLVIAVPFIRSFISVVWSDCGIFIISILKTRSTEASNLFRLASISFIRSWAVPV